MPNANYIDEWRWLRVPLPAIYGLSDPNHHHTWRTKHAEKKREEGKEALSLQKKKKKRKGLMLVDITRLYYHHFMAPTKLIESASPPCTESSLLLAGPPSLHFFLSQNTSRLTWLTHTHTLAQPHFHYGSHWQNQYNTCLPVVCICKCARRIGKDKAGRGFSQGIYSSFLLTSCKGWNWERGGFVCMWNYMCDGEGEWEKRGYDTEYWR